MNIISLRVRIDSVKPNMQKGDASMSWLLQSVLIGLVVGLIVATWWFFWEWGDWRPVKANAAISALMLFLGFLLESAAIKWMALVLGLLGAALPVVVLVTILLIGIYAISKEDTARNMSM